MSSAVLVAALLAVGGARAYTPPTPVPPVIYVAPTMAPARPVENAAPSSNGNAPANFYSPAQPYTPSAPYVPATEPPWPGESEPAPPRQPQWEAPVDPMQMWMEAVDAEKNSAAARSVAGWSYALSLLVLVGATVTARGAAVRRVGGAFVWPLAGMLAATALVPTFWSISSGDVPASGLAIGALAAAACFAVATSTPVPASAAWIQTGAWLAVTTGAALAVAGSGAVARSPSVAVPAACVAVLFAAGSAVACGWAIRNELPQAVGNP